MPGMSVPEPGRTLCRIQSYELIGAGVMDQAGPDRLSAAQRLLQKGEAVPSQLLR